MTDEQFHRLLGELADGDRSLPELSEEFDLTTLSDAQLSELAGIAEFEVAIRDHLSPGQSFSSDVGRKLADEIDAAHFVRDTVVATAKDLDSRRRHRSGLALITMAGIATLAVLAALVLFLRPPVAELAYTPSDDDESGLGPLRQASRQVASVVSVESASEEPHGLEPGAPLLPSVLELREQGSVGLLFRGGSLATLTGPARLELLGPDSAFLHLGTLAVNTGKREGVQFTVHTAGYRVTDRGTAFGITVDPDGTSELSVFEGTVGIEPMDSHTRRQIVAAGQSLSIDATGAPSPGRSPSSSRPAPTPVSVNITPFAPPSGYRDLVHQGGKPIVYLDFQNQADLTTAGVEILGEAEVVRSGDAASLHLPDSPGRNDQGLVLRDPIPFPADGALSIECWICHPIGGTGAIATLAQPGRHREPTPRHTFILSLAEWRLGGIASYIGKPRATFRLGWPVEEPSHNPQPWLFGQDLYLDQLTIPGKWTHLAATYSAGFMRFYRDGKLKSAAAAPRPNQDLPAHLTIGQLSPWESERHFAGMIDEFAIHARELSAEEIRERVATLQKK